jgi:anti-sigma28 factor (negative regulator of flagellin synthesis)
MIVNNSNPLNTPDVQKPNNTAATARSGDSGQAAAGQDQVTLSPAGTSALSSRSEKIAEIKALVNSSHYTPSATDISKKLVSEALSRPADQ